jgi:hypothetical protein
LRYGAFGWSVAVLENNNFTLKALFFPSDFGEGIDYVRKNILNTVIKQYNKPSPSRVQ